MSASSKKKLRKEQKAAAMTKRQKAEKKEATKLKIYTMSFWVVMILIVALVAGIALSGPATSLIQRTFTSVVVGDHKVSHTQLNYFYIDAINQYCSQYSSYLSYLLDTKKPLDEQMADATAGTTWADYFVDMAIDNAKNTYALYDAAKAANYTLDAEEQAAMDELYDSMDSYSVQLGYANANQYLKSIYGDSANKKSYQEYYEVTVIASSYYNAYSEQLKDSYDEPALREFEKDTPYQYNSYSYAYFYMSVDSFKTGGTKGEDGKTTYTDEEVKAAEEAVKKAAESLAVSDNSTVEKLNAAIAEMEKAKAEAEKDTTKEEDKTEEKPSENTQATTPSEEPTEPSEEATEPTQESTEASEETTDPSESTEDATEPKDETDTESDEPVKDEDEKDEDKKDEDKKDEDKKDETKYSTATENTDVLYSKISAVMNEWIRNEDRQAGDITAIPYESTTTGSDGKEIKTLKGYYVVLYLDSNDNNYALANVRHILVAFEGGTKNSTTGQTTYSQAEKDAAKKQAEALLDQWKSGAKTEDSFAELANKESDDGDGTTGGLYEDVYPGQMVTNFNDWCFDETRKPGDTGIVESTYGYHVMYYVSDSEENYRDYMIANDKLSADLETWQTGMNEAMPVEIKSTKHVKKDLVLSTSGLAS